MHNCLPHLRHLLQFPVNITGTYIARWFRQVFHTKCALHAKHAQPSPKLPMRKPSPAEITRAGRIFSRLGASKGGHARAAKLSPERRSEIARIAVQAREAKRKLPGP